MPLDSTQVVRIACDNPNCPGNTLDESDRDGWFFVTGEVYAKGPTTQHVYCSSECLSANADALYVVSPQSLTPPEVAPMTEIPDEPAA